MEEEVVYLMEGKKQRVRKGVGTRCNFERHTSSDPLLLAKSHLLKFPELPKLVPHHRLGIMSTVAGRGNFRIQIITPLKKYIKLSLVFYLSSVG